MNRRNILIVFLTFFNISTAIAKKPKYQKVQWIKLHNETVQPGDFWISANCDPNEPERQGEPDFNLQMQAIHPMYFGTVAKDIIRGNGDYWRPAGLVDVY